MKKVLSIIIVMIMAATIMTLVSCGGYSGSNFPDDLIQLPEAEYKEQCGTYNYEDIMRYPDDYSGKLAVFQGKVVQVLRNGNEFQMRVSVTLKGSYYTDTMFVFYTQKSNENFLEDDIIIMYGELRGTQKYESILGEQIEIPRIFVQYIELVSSTTTTPTTTTTTTTNQDSPVDEQYSEGLAYTINDDGKTCTITGIGTCTDSHVIIPNVLDGYTVTAIETRAFYECTTMTEITIPESVKTIGTQIFYQAENLHTVYYNSTYASKDNNFMSVASIKKVVFGGNKIPSYALYNCGNIETVEIQSSVTSIGYNAFVNCTSLTSIEIPNSVTSIGSSAFDGCAALTSITIPDSVKSINYLAFHDCTSLTNIIIPDSVTTIGYSLFSGCSSLENITIPDSITSIPTSLFYGCKSLSSVTIPDSVTSIGDNAFYKCTSLKSVMIPDSVTTIGEDAFYYCTSLTSVIIPDSVKSIGTKVFYNCTSLSNITIPNSVTSIGDNAFYKCTSLTSVTIPDSVKSIGDESFADCTSLSSAVIGDSVTSIGYRAFKNCTSLTSITISDSVTSMGHASFYNCTSLKDVYYIGNIEDWLNISFDSIHSNPCYRGAKLYFNDELVTSITIPDSVTNVGNYAFLGCTSLTSITISDSVTSMGYASFYNCTSLTSVTFENTEGWWYASDASATSGTSISSTDLADSTTAATYLKSTYCNKYWNRTE